MLHGTAGTIIDGSFDGIEYGLRTQKQAPVASSRRSLG